MGLLHFDNAHEIGTARWVARGLTILIGGFVAVIYLFNEDVRQDPTPPTILMGILTLWMLIAWRWERIGGTLLIFGSLLLFLSMLLELSGVAGLITPIWTLILIGAGISLSYLITGWLFVSVAQHTAVAQVPAGEDEDAVPRKRRLGIYLVIGSLGLAAILFFLVSLTTPVQQNMEEPSFENVGYDHIIAELRAQGAVVGVGSIPAEHPLFSVSGLEFNVDGEILQVFEYVDIVAATNDSSAIYYGENDAWEEIVWTATPHFYQVNNILVMYVGDDAALLSLLEAALGYPFGEDP